MNIFLILLDFGIISCKKFQALLLLLTEIIGIQLGQQLGKQVTCFQVFRDVVRVDCEVGTKIASGLLYCFGQDPIDEEKVFYALWMVQHSSLILRVVEVELRVPLQTHICPYLMFIGVFVKPGEMCRDAGVQSADQVVQYLFIIAKLIKLILEAVLFVDEVPNGSSVVIGETLDVGMNVKVFTLVVGLILHVPHPSFGLFPLIAPQILALGVRTHTIGITPKLRNVSMIAPANTTAVGLAYPFEDTQRTLLVDVQSNDAKIFCLHEVFQEGSCSYVHLLHWVCMKQIGLEEKIVADQIGRDGEQRENVHANYKYQHASVSLGSPTNSIHETKQIFIVKALI